MSPGILGKKIGMTQIFRADGQVVPVTLVKAGPCVVTQRKTPTTDGYDAVQLGLVEFAKAKNITKPMAGHLKKSGADGVRFQREFRLATGDSDLKAGDRILVTEFKPTDKVDVTGVSKGRGFAGFVKRHHFRGGEGSHGRRRTPPWLVGAGAALAGLPLVGGWIDDMRAIPIDVVAAGIARALERDAPQDAILHGRDLWRDPTSG